MSRKFAIEKELREEDLESFRQLCAKPARTYDDLQEWLGDHGYKISRGAVYNYRNNWEETLKKIRASADSAKAFVQVAREGNGVADLSEASLARFQQLMMEKLFQMDAEDGLDSGELMKLSIALKSAVATKQQIEEIKA